jgi:peptidoglycan/LPS O-acetylase OafA/YrhL
MNKRYSELDSIRGLAALMVVLYHYTVRYNQIYGSSIEPAFHFSPGAYGVQLFFIVSGFVIFLTLDKTAHSVDFIVSRLSRLYPAYWISIILTFSVITIFSLPGREVNIQSALINLTMFQQWFNVSNVDGVYWTLAVELSFYFIMYFLFITQLTKRIEIISIIWLSVIIGSQFLEENSGMQIHWAIKLLFLLTYGNLFIAGIMFYKIMHGARSIHYVILLFSLSTEYYLHGEIALLVAAYFSLFLLFAQGNLKILSVKPLIFLGTISYSLYLIHQNIGYVIIQNLEANGLLNSVSIILVPLTISIAIASLIQIYIEKPSLTFVRSKWKESSLRKRLTKNYTNKLKLATPSVSVK